MSSSQPSPQFERLKQHMAQTRLTHTEEWLMACYDWLTESNPSSAMTEAFIQEQVYLQWLDMNLEDMESACLPPQLDQERLTVLQGIYALQVNSVQDIGESSYSQYNKIKKLENENTNVQATDSTEFIASWQPKPRRCLMMTMTDGSQKVYGLEVESIAALSLGMTPGCKVLIYGPVDCRRGVLHLKPKHMKPLGGEVETFVIPNSAENILCKILKKPLSTTSQPLPPPPNNAQPLPPAPNNGNPILRPAPNNAQPQSQSHANSTSSSSVCSFNSRATQPIGTQYRPTQLLPNNARNHNHVPGSSVFDDEGDDFFMEIDEEALLASTASSTQRPPPPPTPITQPSVTQPPSTSKPSKPNSVTKPVAKLPPLKRKPQSSDSNSAAGGSSSSTGNSASDSNAKGRKTRVLGLLKRQQPAAARTHSNGGFNSSDDELFLVDESNLRREPENARVSRVGAALTAPELITLDDEEEDDNTQRVTQPPKTVSTRCKVMPAAPYQYIKQIHSGQFKVGQNVLIKGIISTLTSNIQVDKTSGEWKLSVNINDGSGFLIARISPLVLDRIIGFSPSQMKQIKASKSAVERAKVNEGMKKLTKTLVHFSGIMRIQICAEEKLIIEMLVITNDHVHALATRTSQFAS